MKKIYVLTIVLISYLVETNAWPWISPYAYCNCNPVIFIDPDGRSTWVSQNPNGTYTVQGGALDGDNNIYIYSNGERGACIGQTACTTSFYNSDANEGEGAWMIGAVIDPTDNSGQQFLDQMMSFETTLDNYIDNARNDHPWDFKVTNGGNEVISKEQKFTYRGMQIKGQNGDAVYASARDVGNIAAGMVAAKNGIPWSAARLAFDAYQSIHDRTPKVEGISTQNAERYGWNLAATNTSGLKKLVNFSLTANSTIRRIKHH